ncbi:DUF1412 domain-containing protein [Caenorhabditis elegans]|uniref:Secreted protein n=1 Tax=Caenorhabditis elegans TaxID=6239 RepID=Q9NAK2_CAEEL|nr:Secreted protein [Caenorhabditis elegans]CAB54400.1 Secreted protein [Caenorhabditis elegans]|eukprot:NP_496692.1 Uncharacterized protein CELE_Y38E10A.9 [Caenorhabditis elegans]
MFSNLFIFLVLSLLLSTVSVSAGAIRQRRATPELFNPNGVIVNMVSDPVAGGPMEMGWLQVPHIDNPMYAPVEEKKA